MSMSAEDALYPPGARVKKRAFRNSGFQAQPTRVHPVDQARKSFAVAVKFLQRIEKALAPPADELILPAKGVELVSVYGQVALALELPYIALIYRNAHQVRHDLRKPLVVISLHPYYFHFALRVGELADAREKFPVLAGQPPEVQIAEDIAQQHQSAEGSVCQQRGSLARPAHFAAQVQVGKNQSVQYLLCHNVTIMIESGYRAVNPS